MPSSNSQPLGDEYIIKITDCLWITCRSWGRRVCRVREGGGEWKGCLWEDRAAGVPRVEWGHRGGCQSVRGGPAGCDPLRLQSATGQKHPHRGRIEFVNKSRGRILSSGWMLCEFQVFEIGLDTGCLGKAYKCYGSPRKPRRHNHGMIFNLAFCCFLPLAVPIT